MRMFFLHDEKFFIFVINNIISREPKQERRPKTPGSLSNQEIADMQNAFGTRSKMARTPVAPPAVPLEPLPQIKPRPKKKA